ncbi:MAG: hypothetical protein K5930_00365 [Treponemataceae bacterium]|nr:hypothetical protein [Treponemataceae bacterium]
MTVKYRFLVLLFLFSAPLVQADTFTQGQTGQLRSFVTDEETYGFSSDATNLQSIYVVSEDGITLRMYDDQNRIERETRWNKDYSKIDSVFEYTYSGTKMTPSSKIEKYPSQSKEIEIQYNDTGIEEKRVVYKTEGTRREVVETVTWEYDSKGRIAEEKHLSGGTSPSEDKYAYLYNDNDLPPDYYVYKDGVLLEKTAYVSDTEYWSVVYFGNYEVWTRYVYGEKKEELYKLDGVIQRRSSF